MKKILSSLLAIVLVLSFAACQKAPSAEDTQADDTTTTEATTEKDLSPAEKLDAYITENGTQTEDKYVLECPEIADKIIQSDFTLGNMQNLKASNVTEFSIVKDANGISLELTDSQITDNGIKMTRSVLLNTDGSFKYQNILIMNGIDMGGNFEGEILPETYTKAITPVITKTEFASGAQLNDASKELLKDYIDLTLDCYADVLSRDGLGITLADVGFSSYVPSEPAETTSQNQEQ